jgi:hypothetical protein
MLLTFVMITLDAVSQIFAMGADEHDTNNHFAAT